LINESFFQFGDPYLSQATDFNQFGSAGAIKEVEK